VLVVAAAVNGCQKSEQIAHYRVPKEQEVSLPAEGTETASTAGGENGSESGADSARSERMLAAIVPHGATAWFFKLAGPADAVSKQAETFNSLIQSVVFSKSAGGKPQWTLPEGWQQKPGSEMRFATLVLPAEAADAASGATTNAGANSTKGGASLAKPLEVSVTSLPWSAADDTQQLLANVNRWRGQMELKPLTAAELPSETSALELSGEKKTTATLVDLTGHMKAGGMQPPFAGAAGARKGLPPGHPDVSNRLPAGHPAVADAAPSNRLPMAASSNVSGSKADATSERGHPSLTARAMPATTADSDLPFTFSAPSGWKSAALPTFAVAAFTVSENSPRAEVTVTPLPESPGGIAANVNRWRGQLGLSPASEDELAAEVQPYQVDGQPAHLVRLTGPEDANPQRAITAAVVTHDGVNWIFALKTEAAVAQREQANFEKFVGSVKFSKSEN
jgi:hypothetical protein